MNQAKIKKRMRIALCLPGQYWKKGFLTGAFETIAIMSAHGIEVLGSMEYSSIVATARNMCAGGASKFGPRQKPFNGQLDYDYMLWIDSDQTFTFAHFTMLMERQRDICAGWYRTVADHASVCLKADDERFKEEGVYKLMSPEEVDEYKTPFKADFVGFGFVLIKKGVFENIDYPWFSQDRITMNNGVVREVGEDVTFCRKAREAGFSIWVDPEVRVGHTKSFDI